ncbi:MAG: 30S ribosomal protein S1 [Bacteroidales bacterium]|nr:30S ribosomal protein S1 [Bacteroidales bacterium]
MSKFYIRQAKDGQYYFSLKSEQGSTLLSSEMYTTLKACENGLASVKKNAAQTAQYEYKEAANGKFHFNLKAANHQVIGSSTMYETEQAAQEAAAVVAAEAADAEVVSEIEGASKEEAPAEAPVVEAAPAAAPAAEQKSAARKSSLNASVKPEDFDWDAFEGSDVYGAADRKAIDEAYENTLSKVVENEVVEGEVTAITKREVVVTIGGKSEGVIPVSEFRYDSDLAVGDKVEVYVESAEDKKGQLVLSHRKARTLKSWDRVNEAFEKDEIVKGFVKTRTKGGMIVDVFGIEAFLPGSQIDIKPIRDYDQYVNQNIDCKIVKINQEFRNVVVSHKALLEAEQEQKRAELIGKLEKGQVLEGVVKNITNYGVFVDLGGVDGLIHITDLSWGRINHPEEVVSLDEKIKVVVLDFNEQQKRIALGLKQLTAHPWDNLNPDLKVGDKVKGKVILIADYGAFVEIEPGVEGLVHVSEMSWSPRLHSAQEFLKVGDEVEAQILSIDREARKISLGLKQLTENPWENIREKYPVGSKHKAVVRNITNFGVFAELEDGVEGLIHISDLSWNKIKHPSELVAAGDSIDVQILDFDEANHKLSLGLKQLTPNPWDEIEAKYPVGSTVEGTVASMTDKGANITLEGDAEGFAFNRELVKEDGKQAVVGDTLPFRVVELRRSTRRILLSHVRTYAEMKEKAAAAEVENTKKAVKKVNANVEKTTLGDIDALAALKEKFEKGE